MKNTYTITTYIENNIPISFNITKKELLKKVKYFNIENTKKVICWNTTKSTRYYFRQNEKLYFILSIDENI